MGIQETFNLVKTHKRHIKEISYQQNKQSSKKNSGNSRLKALITCPINFKTLGQGPPTYWLPEEMKIC